MTGTPTNAARQPPKRRGVSSWPRPRCRGCLDLRFCRRADGRRVLCRRPPSTTGSAAPPASTAPPRSPPRRPQRASTARSRCGSIPVSAVGPALEVRAGEKTEIEVGSVRSSPPTIRSPISPRGGRRARRRPTMSRRSPSGPISRRSTCFCFTEQQLAAGREARDGGGVLCRSGADVG